MLEAWWEPASSLEKTLRKTSGDSQDQLMQANKLMITKKNPLILLKSHPFHLDWQQSLRNSMVQGTICTFLLPLQFIPRRLFSFLRLISLWQASHEGFGKEKIHIYHSASGNHHSIYCFCEFDCRGFHIQERSWYISFCAWYISLNICPLGSGWKRESQRTQSSS